MVVVLALLVPVLLVVLLLLAMVLVVVLVVRAAGGGAGPRAGAGGSVGAGWRWWGWWWLCYALLVFSVPRSHLVRLPRSQTDIIAIKLGFHSTVLVSVPRLHCKTLFSMMQIGLVQ